MKPRIIKTGIAEYEVAHFPGTDPSGIVPLGDELIVKLDKIMEKTSGGILLPEAKQDEMAEAAETGVVFAVADGAFAWTRDRTRPFSGRKPEPGDRVAMVRWAGIKVLGEDGEWYQAISDGSVYAILWQ